jgi:hypothetical protein
MNITTEETLALFLVVETMSKMDEESMARAVESLNSDQRGILLIVALCALEGAQKGLTWG